MLEKLETALKRDNILYETFQLNKEQMSIVNAPEMHLVLTSHLRDRNAFTGAYNMPKSSQIALLVPASPARMSFVDSRAIVLTLKGGDLQYISDIHHLYDAWHYVLLFSHGESGWDEDYKSRNISLKDFACYRLMYRTNDSCKNCRNDKEIFAREGVRPDHANPILQSGRLCQQYIVDIGSRIEDHRLLWAEFNQAKCRIETYRVLMDAL